MISIALAVAFAQLTPPNSAIPNAGSVVYGDDYPAGARARGEEGQVFVEVLVNPLGRVDSCTILLSSGFPELDNATCGILLKRATFKPARDADGNPIYSFFRSPRFTWSLGRYQRPREVTPDFELTINRAPIGYKMPINLEVDFQTSPTGSTSDCKPASDAPVELAKLACDTIAQSKMRIATDRSGKPVTARDLATFRFVAAKP